MSLRLLLTRRDQLNSTRSCGKRDRERREREREKLNHKHTPWQAKHHIISAQPRHVGILRMWMRRPLSPPSSPLSFGSLVPVGSRNPVSCPGVTTHNRPTTVHPPYAGRSNCIHYYYHISPFLHPPFSPCFITPFHSLLLASRIQGGPIYCPTIFFPTSFKQMFRIKVVGL